jgi:hypothetical protein
VPAEQFQFSRVSDAKRVLVDCGLFAAANVRETCFGLFAGPARQLGAGRYISKGVRAPNFVGAIGYFQSGNEPFAQGERETLALGSEIVHLALAGWHYKR